MLINFNRAPFNRQLSIDVYLSAVIHGGATVGTSPIADVILVAEMHGVGAISAAQLKESYIDAEMHGASTLDFALVREFFNSAEFHGSGTVAAELGRFRVGEIIVNGPFAPGEKIVIDSARFRVTKNGQIAPYDGDFFEVNPGRNSITYRDTAAARSVQMRITWRDRYL